MNRIIKINLKTDIVCRGKLTATIILAVNSSVVSGTTTITIMAIDGYIVVLPSEEKLEVVRLTKVSMMAWSVADSGLGYRTKERLVRVRVILYVVFRDHNNKEIV